MFAREEFFGLVCMELARNNKSFEVNITHDNKVLLTHEFDLPEQFEIQELIDKVMFGEFLTYNLYPVIELGSSGVTDDGVDVCYCQAIWMFDNK